MTTKQRKHNEYRQRKADKRRAELKRRNAGKNTPPKRGNDPIPFRMPPGAIMALAANLINPFKFQSNFDRARL